MYVCMYVYMYFYIPLHFSLIRPSYWLVCGPMLGWPASHPMMAGAAMKHGVLLGAPWSPAAALKRSSPGTLLHEC